MNNDTTTTNLIIAVLLNNSMILGFERAEPPPDLEPLRKVLTAGTARLSAGPGLLGVVFEDRCGAGHFQISLNDDLICEFIVCPRASDTTAWKYFLDRFHQRAASGRAFREGPTPSKPFWEPWVATFLSHAALRLTPDANALLRGTMLALARWYLG